MNLKLKNSHFIDMLFPISLFFVFAVSALLVIVLSSQAYQSTSQKAENTFNSRTSISYISEKIRQNDMKNAISISEIKGQQCLKINQNYSEQQYSTYIYEYQGQLMEMFVIDSTDFLLNNGSPLLEIEDFSLSINSGNLLKIIIKDKSGASSSTSLLLRAGGSYE